MVMRQRRRNDEELPQVFRNPRDPAPPVMGAYTVTFYASAVEPSECPEFPWAHDGTIAREGVGVVALVRALGMQHALETVNAVFQVSVVIAVREGYYLPDSEVEWRGYLSEDVFGARPRGRVGLMQWLSNMFAN